MEAKDSQAIAGNAADKVARVGKVDKVNKVDRNGRVDSVSKVLKVSNDNHAQHPKHGWEVKKLGEVCAFQRGLTYSKDDEVEFSNNCVLRSNNIDLNTMSIILDELKYLKEDFVIKEDKKVRSNSILICMSNGSKQHIGKVAFIDKEYGYAFGGFMGLIKPNKYISSKFIYYSCISSSYRNFLTEIGNGANITNLKFTDLEKFPIAIPPMEEQERIVAELDCLSGVIEKKRQQLKEYDALAQSIFYDMFGDPISNEKGWEVKRLGEIGEIISGSTPSTTDESNWGGDINWVTPAELNTQLFYGNTIRKITEKAAKSLILMPIGTVLLSSRAPIGKLAITTAPMCCNQGFKNIICGNEINNIFLYHYLMLTMDDIKALGRGATFKEVSKKNISDYKIYIPPVSLQEEFAEKIEAIEKQKELLKRSIKEIETLFDARMEYYFGDT